MKKGKNVAGRQVCFGIAVVFMLSIFSFSLSFAAEVPQVPEPSAGGVDMDTAIESAPPDMANTEAAMGSVPPDAADADAASETVPFDDEKSEVFSEGDPDGQGNAEDNAAPQKQPVGQPLLIPAPDIPEPAGSAPGETSEVSMIDVQAASPPARVIEVFPDEAFAQIIVRNAAGIQNIQSTITQTDLDRIKDLTISYSNVTSLEGIGNLRNLKDLLLVNNEQLCSLPQEMESLQSLKTLDIVGCPVGNMPAWMGNLSALESLSYRDCGAAAIPDTLGNLAGLKKLDISGGLFTRLPDAIGGLQGLETLDVHASGLREIPAAIGNLTNLTSLRMHENALVSLPAEIGRLTQLKELSLNENALETLPVECGNLSLLTDLHLADNRLSSLPPEIYNMRSLKILNLEGNALTVLPDGIGRLQNLELLYVGGNQLSELPDGLAWCQNLRQIFAMDNQITQLPSDIGRLKKLWAIYMEGNCLQSLPQSIGGCENMRVMTLSDNQLSGLPQSIAGLDLCYMLSLGNNELSAYPLQVNDMAGLTTLDISGNHITDISQARGFASFNAKGQSVRIEYYRKSFPYTYTLPLGSVALWDRGYGVNEVIANEVFDGRSFKLSGASAIVNLEGPSGQFGVAYYFQARSVLNIDQDDITLKVGEDFYLAPVSDVMAGYEVEFSVSIDDPYAREIFTVDRYGRVVALKGGAGFLTICGEVVGTDVTGRLSVKVEVEKEAEEEPEKELLPLELYSVGLEDGYIAYIGKTFMLVPSDSGISKEAIASMEVQGGWDDLDGTALLGTQASSRSAGGQWTWDANMVSSNPNIRTMAAFTPKAAGETTLVYINEHGQRAEKTIVIVDPYDELVLLEEEEIPTAPKTGDSRTVWPWAICAAVATVCLAAQAGKRKIKS